MRFFFGIFMNTAFNQKSPFRTVWESRGKQKHDRLIQERKSCVYYGLNKYSVLGENCSLQTILCNSAHWRLDSEVSTVGFPVAVSNVSSGGDGSVNLHLSYLRHKALKVIKHNTRSRGTHTPNTALYSLPFTVHVSIWSEGNGIAVLREKFSVAKISV